MNLRIVLLTFIVILSSIILSLQGIAKLSKKQEAKLDKLTEISKPTFPIFGKINEPLKAGVSIFQYAPSTINIEKGETFPEVIKLSSKGTSISALELERKELQKAEVEGLNFIQPSLEVTTEEQKAIDEFFSRNEQEQLLNLWKATIERNKTIQFIIQKLAPLESPQASHSILAKTIGAAIFLPFYALQAFSGNNAGAFYGSQLGGRVLGSVVEGKMKKDQAQLQLSQTESIILFMMIDEVAERLRQRYHNYKRYMVERALATNELEETKKDSLDARESDSPGAELIATIQRRSVEREIRRLDAQSRAQRNALVELAGPEVVSLLDEQLKLELAATKNTPLDF